MQLGNTSMPIAATRKRLRLNISSNYTNIRTTTDDYRQLRRSSSCSQLTMQWREHNAKWKTKISKVGHETGAVLVTISFCQERSRWPTFYIFILVLHSNMHMISKRRGSLGLVSIACLHDPTDVITAERTLNKTIIALIIKTWDVSIFFFF